MKMKIIQATALLLCLSGCATPNPSVAFPNLALTKIIRDPFMFRCRFNSASEFPVGKDIHGFTVVKFTPKTEKKTLSSGHRVTVDVSELILKRGEKCLTLVAGRPVPYEEHIVHFVDQSDGAKYSARTGGTLTVGPHRFLLTHVSVEQQICTLEDIDTKKQLTIKRGPNHQIEPTSGKPRDARLP